jgi:hypothetical protein
VIEGANNSPRTAHSAEHQHVDRVPISQAERARSELRCVGRGRALRELRGYLSAMPAPSATLLQLVAQVDAERPLRAPEPPVLEHLTDRKRRAATATVRARGRAHAE